MKSDRLIVCVVLTMVSAMFMSGCADQHGIDNRDTDYG